MATDNQWSGLLIVVIFVAIFAITSVSAMAIYFFCKCHHKKKKINMQVRPAPNRNRLDDEDDNEDGEQGFLFERRDDRLQRVTNTNRDSPNARGLGGIYNSPQRLDTPAVTGIGSNYMAPLNKRRSREDRDIFKSQRLVKVDEDGTYDSHYSDYTPAVTNIGSSYMSPLNKRMSREDRDIFKSQRLVKVDEDGINKRRSREDRDIFKSQRLDKVDEDGTYDSHTSDQPVPNTFSVNKINRKRRHNSNIKDNNVQYTGITDNYKTAQILRVDHHDDNVQTFGGIYRTPQRVRSRESTSRGSCARSTSPFGERKTEESIDRENTQRGRRTADNTQSNPARFMFTASSKMAWGFDS